MKRCLLIDGSSYLYRAFHALPPLTTATGEPTGALLGVVNMLRASLADTWQVMAFVMDTPGPTFRHRLDPLYKAHRPPMPDALRAQIAPLHAIVKALGLPLVQVDHVEADDVIATLALRAVAEGLDVEISSGDKDFAQLVRPQISLINTMTNSRLVTGEDVRKKFGVLPEQIVDYLALMGDAADNVRGVEKCGPKTAAKWLEQYGSLATLMAHAPDIKGKIGENLRAALPRLAINQQLVCLKTDVALDVGLADLSPAPANRESLRQLYTHYQFNQALRELDAALIAPMRQHDAEETGVRHSATQPPTPPAIDRSGYATLTTWQDLDAWLDCLSRAALFAFDTETDRLDPLRAELVGISFCDAPGHAAYLPLGHTGCEPETQLDRAKVIARLRAVFADPTIHKVAQNGKYDLHILNRHGLHVAGYVEDTMLQSFILDAGQTRHDLDTLAKRHLGHQTITFEEVCGKGVKQCSFAQLDIATATQYAAEDADVTLQVHRTLLPRLQALPRLEQVYRDIEIPLVQVLTRMEACGVCIDADLLRNCSSDFARRMDACSERAWDLAGHSFNLDSPKQLQTILYDELQLPVLSKTPKGQPSCNEDTLQALISHHPLPDVILQYRSLAKLRNTYTDKLPEMIHPQTQRVHTSYHQAGAVTGRLSSSDPNLQNIPIRTEDGRRIRQAFIAPPGWRLLACDYSQIELRIMAHLSGDPALRHAFLTGNDVHRATAADVFNRSPESVSTQERRAAKAINFGLIYGMSAFGLARQLGISRNEAQGYIAAYFDRYPKVRDYMEQTRAHAEQYGYVETVFGRRLHVGDGHRLRPGNERAAINAPMQGTAADIIKRAMIALDQWLEPHRERARMILQVHDELIFEVDADFVATVRSAATTLMESAAQLDVPLVVESGVGLNWDQAH